MTGRKIVAVAAAAAGIYGCWVRVGSSAGAHPTRKSPSRIPVPGSSRTGSFDPDSCGAARMTI